MNSALKASMEAMPERTIYSVASGVAVAGAAMPLALVAILRPSLGVIVGYALGPLLLALAGWLLFAVLRLGMVGFLPSEADGLIPPRLVPWIRSWLLVGFGLLGSLLLVVLAGVVMAIAHGPFGRAIEALVYVVWFRIFLDAIFGAAFNAGVISSRR